MDSGLFFELWHYGFTGRHVPIDDPWDAWVVLAFAHESPDIPGVSYRAYAFVSRDGFIDDDAISYADTIAINNGNTLRYEKIFLTPNDMPLTTFTFVWGKDTVSIPAGIISDSEIAAPPLIDTISINVDSSTTIPVAGRRVDSLFIRLQYQTPQTDTTVTWPAMTIQDFGVVTIPPELIDDLTAQGALHGTVITFTIGRSYLRVEEVSDRRIAVLQQVDKRIVMMVE